MGKLATYLFILCGVILLFGIAGLLQEGTSVSSQLLDLMLNPETIKTSTFWVSLSTSVGTLVISGTIISFFARGSTVLVVRGALAVLLVEVGWNLFTIFNILAQWNGTVALLIISPLLFLYGFTVMEWVTGIND